MVENQRDARVVITNMKLGRIVWVGLLQALGVIAYCLLVAQLAFNEQGPIFFKILPFPVAPAFFFATLTFSVAAVGTIIFAYPVILLLRQEYAQAVKLVASTIAWGLILILAILISLS